MVQLHCGTLKGKTNLVFNVQETVNRLKVYASQMTRLGLDVGPSDTPIRFGSWVGGDRDGNPFVTSAVTRDIVASQHEHAMRNLVGAIEALAADLSTSSRVRDVSDELEESLASVSVSEAVDHDKSDNHRHVPFTVVP